MARGDWVAAERGGAAGRLGVASTSCGGMAMGAVEKWCIGGWGSRGGTTRRRPTRSRRRGRWGDRTSALGPAPWWLGSGGDGDAAHMAWVTARPLGGEAKTSARQRPGVSAQATARRQPDSAARRRGRGRP
ncbi:Os01g0337700, partial [Oryza sativa Japonica Group]|uniref:Os01g0337700 protein n=5 Tax=Oryza TaxID=4527 RepID=A2ZSP2_ORYSJ|eukprot:NP_001042940.1 Os01g0337700 [Oryza sativa Japonica Group]